MLGGYGGGQVPFDACCAAIERNVVEINDAEGEVELGLWGSRSVYGHGVMRN